MFLERATLAAIDMEANRRTAIKKRNLQGHSMDMAASFFFPTTTSFRPLLYQTNF